MYVRWRDAMPFIVLFFSFSLSLSVSLFVSLSLCLSVSVLSLCLSVSLCLTLSSCTRLAAVDPEKRSTAWDSYCRLDQLERGLVQ